MNLWWPGGSRLPLTRTAVGPEGAMGKATKVVGAIVAFVLGGCTGSGPARDDLKGGVGGAAGSMPSAAGGDGAPAGPGSGGHTGSPSARPGMACGPLMFVAPLTLA